MKKMKILLIPLAVALVALLVFAGLVGYICWQQTHIPPAQNYDAIIVLGAQVLPDKQPSVQLSWRLDAGIEAWEKHPCPIVVCGAQGRTETEPEAISMQRYLENAGVDASYILADPDSKNTKQNIENAAKLLQAYEIGKVLIVTSDYHLPRAMALAKDQGLNATGIGSPCKQEYWFKNHSREALSWIKYLLQKYL